jgi:hypothetical protein
MPLGRSLLVAVLLATGLTACRSESDGATTRLTYPDSPPESVESHSGAGTVPDIAADTSTAVALCADLAAKRSELELRSRVVPDATCAWSDATVVLRVDAIDDMDDALEVFQETGDPIDAPMVHGNPGVVLRMANGRFRLGVFGRSWRVTVDGATALASSNELLERTDEIFGALRAGGRS